MLSQIRLFSIIVLFCATPKNSHGNFALNRCLRLEFFLSSRLTLLASVKPAMPRSYTTKHPAIWLVDKFFPDKQTDSFSFAFTFFCLFKAECTFLNRTQLDKQVSVWFIKINKIVKKGKISIKYVFIIWEIWNFDLHLICLGVIADMTSSDNLCTYFVKS